MIPQRRDVSGEWEDTRYAALGVAVGITALLLPFFGAFLVLGVGGETGRTVGLVITVLAIALVPAAIGCCLTEWLGSKYLRRFSPGTALAIVVVLTYCVVLTALALLSWQGALGTSSG